jgi:hypothetical protein
LAQITIAVATQKLSFRITIAVFFESMFFPFPLRLIQRGKMPSACSKGKPEQRVIVPRKRTSIKKKPTLLALAFPKRDSKSFG